MKILVLGGTGFLGRAVAQELSKKGYSDVVLSGIEDADLTVEGDVKRLYGETNPDVAINLAAFVGGIGLNKENPGRMFYDNVKIGAFCTHYAMESEVQKYIFVGSVCSYPKHTPVPFEESYIWDGYPEETNAPYGVYKRAIGVMMDGYHRQYGLNCVYLIPVNMYGPHDNFDLQSSHVIPAIIRKMMEANGGPVTLWGDGSATREFLYVEDCARAIVMAMESNINNPLPINIGSGDEISIKDLSHKIAEYSKFKGTILWDTSLPNGQPRRCLNVDRAKEMLGFNTAVTLDDGLRRTIEWYVNK